MKKCLIISHLNIKMEWTDEANSLPQVKDIEVTTKSGKFYMIIDERWNQSFFSHIVDLSQLIENHEWTEEMFFLNSE